MYIDYVIQNGDTLESISKKTNVPMFQILIQNGLEDAFSLTPGNTIQIPSTYGTMFVKYTVEKGDTLSSIAKEYGTTVDLIKQINGLENTNFLYENEFLFLPREDVVIYFTEEGDTLESVAEKTGKSILELVEENQKIYLFPSQLIAYRKEQ